ncbi:hypothetical protein [Austwickia sp. TVS 96-490-7B]|uniref:hypothetical protein n=1 Tax=Austwickia sp. TVS 96-490-7B TaxID=2830843 RepID=UPI001C56C8F7|nr:hypothetical protein [Austwickia sp. TVS 96-490-7B]
MSQFIYTRHGAGKWNSIHFAPSIEVFVESLAIFEEVLLGDFAEDVWGSAGFIEGLNNRLEVHLEAQ